MAWVGTRPVSWHYGRTEKDYSHQLALRAKYPHGPAPIEELKKACLLDGYPPEQVAKMKYANLEDVDVEKLLRPAYWEKKQKKLEEQSRIERLFQDQADEPSDNEEEDEPSDEAFDIDHFDDSNEEEEYYNSDADE